MKYNDIGTNIIILIIIIILGIITYEKFFRVKLLQKK